MGYLKKSFFGRRLKVSTVGESLILRGIAKKTSEIANFTFSLTLVSFNVLALGDSMGTAT